MGLLHMGGTDLFLKKAPIRPFSWGGVKSSRSRAPPCAPHDYDWVRMLLALQFQRHTLISLLRCLSDDGTPRAGMLRHLSDEVTAEQLEHSEVAGTASILEVWPSNASHRTRSACNRLLRPATTAEVGNWADSPCHAVRLWS